MMTDAETEMIRKWQETPDGGVFDVIYRMEKDAAQLKELYDNREGRKQLRERDNRMALCAVMERLQILLWLTRPQE